MGSPKDEGNSGATLGEVQTSTEGVDVEEESTGIGIVAETPSTFSKHGSSGSVKPRKVGKRKSKGTGTSKRREDSCEIENSPKHLRRSNKLKERERDGEGDDGNSTEDSVLSPRRRKKKAEGEEQGPLSPRKRKLKSPRPREEGGGDTNSEGGNIYS